jgi:polyisoprenoid-binding protein YceI
MAIKNSIKLSVLILLLASISYGADTFKIDPVHSAIGFSVRHLVISNVKGNFTDYSGTIVYDSLDISKSSVEISIKASSINTDNTDRDKHLQGPDFFDAVKFQEIAFKSSKIEKKDGILYITGNLTMHGVTKELTFPFSILGTTNDPWGNFRMGAEAGLELNRQDFGLAWNKALETGGLVVGNEVKIELNIEAVKQK